LTGIFSVGTGKACKETIEGMVLLNEEDNIFDVLASLGVESIWRIEGTPNTYPERARAAGHQKLQKATTRDSR
jgi:hypothetical protein